MEQELMMNHVLMSLIGAGVYNGIAFVGKSRKEGLKYDLQKGLRAGVAGLIQAGASIGLNWVPAVGMSPLDLGLIGMGAAAGIDNGMKILGWRVPEKG